MLKDTRGKDNKPCFLEIRFLPENREDKETLNLLASFSGKIPHRFLIAGGTLDGPISIEFF